MLEKAKKKNLTFSLGIELAPQKWQKVYGMILLTGLLLSNSLWLAIHDTALPRKVLAALLRF